MNLKRLLRKSRDCIQFVTQVPQVISWVINGNYGEIIIKFPDPDPYSDFIEFTFEDETEIPPKREEALELPPWLFKEDQASITGYLTHQDYEDLEKTLEYPEESCPQCDSLEDCPGPGKCFNPKNYKLLRIETLAQ